MRATFSNCFIVVSFGQEGVGARRRSTVVSDGFHWAFLERLAALLDLLVGLRLADHEREALGVVAIEHVRGGLTAEIAVDALSVDVELTRVLARELVIAICHGIPRAHPRAIPDARRCEIKSYTNRSGVASDP